MNHERRIAVSLYCNGCGLRFSAWSHYQRFCSSGCASRFWGPLQRVLPTADGAPTQNRILTELRRLDGHWIDRGALVAAVYGLDDVASRHAFTVALHRLRATWGDLGLVVGCRVERLAPDRASATSYCLAHDIQQPAEGKSA